MKINREKKLLLRWRMLFWAHFIEIVLRLTVASHIIIGGVQFEKVTKFNKSVKHRVIIKTFVISLHCGIHVSWWLLTLISFLSSKSSLFKNMEFSFIWLVSSSQRLFGLHTWTIKELKTTKLYFWKKMQIT